MLSYVTIGASVETRYVVDAAQVLQALVGLCGDHVVDEVGVEVGEAGERAGVGLLEQHEVLERIARAYDGRDDAVEYVGQLERAQRVQVVHEPHAQRQVVLFVDLGDELLLLLGRSHSISSGSRCVHLLELGLEDARKVRRVADDELQIELPEGGEQTAEEALGLEPAVLDLLDERVAELEAERVERIDLVERSPTRDQVLLELGDHLLEADLKVDLHGPLLHEVLVGVRGEQVALELLVAGERRALGLEARHEVEGARELLMEEVGVGRREDHAQIEVERAHHVRPDRVEDEVELALLHAYRLVRLRRRRLNSASSAYKLK